MSNQGKSTKSGKQEEDQHVSNIKRRLKRKQGEKFGQKGGGVKREEEGQKKQQPTAFCESGKGRESGAPQPIRRKPGTATAHSKHSSAHLKNQDQTRKRPRLQQQRQASTQREASSTARNKRESSLQKERGGATIGKREHRHSKSESADWKTADTRKRRNNSTTAHHTTTATTTGQQQQQRKRNNFKKPLGFLKDKYHHLETRRAYRSDKITQPHTLRR